jgi:hypothetical protein
MNPSLLLVTLRMDEECRISGSHRHGCEALYLLGYNAVQSIQIQPIFRNKMSPLFSASKNKPSKKPEWSRECVKFMAQYSSCRFHDSGWLSLKRTEENKLKMKSSVFWDVTLCSAIQVYRRFGGTYSQAGISDSKLTQSVNFHGAMWPHIQKDSRQRCEILKFGLDPRCLKTKLWGYIWL